MIQQPEHHASACERGPHPSSDKRHRRRALLASTPAQLASKASSPGRRMEMLSARHAGAQAPNMRSAREARLGEPPGARSACHTLRLIDKGRLGDACTEVRTTLDPYNSVDQSHWQT